MSELCAYGCGLPGLFRHAKKGTPRCSENISNCPAIKAEKIEKRAIHEAKRKAEKAEFLANPEPCSKCGGVGVYFNDRTKKWSCTVGKIKCPASVQKYNDTMMDRYQTTNMAHIDGVQEKRSEILKQQHEERGEEGRKAIDLKRQETMYERTGYRNIGQVPENKIRVAEGNQEKFGYRNTLQVPEFREKGKQTMLSTIGVDHPLKSPEIRENMRKTVQAEYGTDNVMQNAVVNAKKISTNMERHGGPSPMANPEMVERVIKNSRLRKDFILPSGKIVVVQGYEPQAIEYLFSLGYQETDLVFETTNKPRVKWIDETNNPHTYYPDLFVPVANHVIEVKSKWTLYNSLWFENNLRKADATLNAGFRFTFLVFDDRGCFMDAIGDKI